jgi:hypothetical protein
MVPTDGRGSRWREIWVSQVVRRERAVSERARAWVCNECVLGVLRGWSCGRFNFCLQQIEAYQPLAYGASTLRVPCACLLPLLEATRTP